MIFEDDSPQLQKTDPIDGKVNNQSFPEHVIPNPFSLKPSCPLPPVSPSAIT